MGKQTDKIKVSAGEDLLAFIPHMVGYWPRHSIVCIGMAGKRLRATMRLDLPPDSPTGMGNAGRGATGIARFAGIAAAQLASDTAADGCLIAIFGRADWAGPDDFAQAGVYGALREAFADVGLPVRDAWFVGPDHWRSLVCTDATCCPWPGKNNASIKASFVNAEFIFRGSMVGESPQEQIRQWIAVRDQDFAALVAAAGNGVRDALPAGASGIHQLAAILGAWEHCLTRWPETPDPAMTAYLLASLVDVRARDAVMVALASTPERALAGAAAMGLLHPDPDAVLVPPNWHGGNQAAACAIDLENCDAREYGRASRDFGNILIGEISTGEDRAGPDWGRLDRVEPLLHFLAGATNSGDKAPVLCLLGWIQWCKGRGTWAGTYFHACQDFAPGYRLAGLLDQLLAVGHIAACAKDPRTAWHGRRQDDVGDRAA